MEKNKQEQNDMKKVYDLLNKLIKDEKIKFKFYNRKIPSLDLLMLCHNKIDNTIEFLFRDVMAEHIVELKEIMKSDNKKYNN